MKYYTDGSSTIGVKSAHCVTDEKGGIVVYEETLPKDDGTPHYYTNNEEEYRGVIAALNIAKEGDSIITDSQLIVNQIKGLYKVKAPHLRKLCENARELSQQKKVCVIWIPREENLAGKVFEK